MPDLLGYWLTGSLGAEETKRVDDPVAQSRRIRMDAELIAKLGVSPGLFPPIRRPGEQLGPLVPEVLAETGLDYPVPFHSSRLARHRIGGHGCSSR